MRSTIARFAPLARPAHGDTRPVGPRARRRRPQPVEARSSAVIDCAAYIDGRRVDAPELESAVRLVREDHHGTESKFVWVGMHEPEAAELEQLAAVFGLHPLAVEDAVHAHQRPKLERYDDTLFVVFKTVHYAGHRGTSATSTMVGTGEVMVFLGPDFAITVRHGKHGALGSVRRQLEDASELLTLGPAAVLHAVADRVVDDYLSATGAMQADIDEVETSVFSPERSHDIERIYQLKRELIELKRAVAPLTEPLRLLTARAYRVVPSQIREYFRDVDDHLARVREQVASYDELLTTVLQANLAQVTVAENADMRKISAWAAIFAVPTSICSIYGMNFDAMPELHWRFSYPLVLMLIVATCGTLYRGFRRNGWL